MRPAQWAKNGLLFAGLIFGAKLNDPLAVATAILAAVAFCFLSSGFYLINDVRDGAHDERLAAVAGDAGCHACHTHLSCTERCPKAISPTAAIAGLKRATFSAALKGKL